MLENENVSYWTVFQNRNLLLVNINERLCLPTLKQLNGLSNQFLYSLKLDDSDELCCSCAEISTDIILDSNFSLVPIKQAFEILGEKWFSKVAKSIKLLNWYKNHRFCGCCGKLNKLNIINYEAVCSECNLVFYPRISPSIIVLIRKGNKLLLARGPHFAKGIYGLIAGFVSPGETLEEAVKREVFEEVSIKIKNIKYYGSQPWPFPDSLMMAFTADYDSGEIIIDNIEIEEAGWFDIDNMPGVPSSKKSIAWSMIEEFIRAVSY